MNRRGPINAKLTPATVQALNIAHLQVLDDIARGDGRSDEPLWALVGAAITWLRVAHAIGQGVDEMQAQHDLAMRVMARHAATGRVVFTGPDYLLAKAGVDVMDALAEVVPWHVANRAANYSEQRVNELRKAHQARTRTPA